MIFFQLMRIYNKKNVNCRCHFIQISSLVPMYVQKKSCKLYNFEKSSQNILAHLEGGSRLQGDPDGVQAHGEPLPHTHQPGNHFKTKKYFFFSSDKIVLADYQEWYHYICFLSFNLTVILSEKKRNEHLVCKRD